MNIKLLNMDCLSWLKAQATNTIDIIITSPPYNLKSRSGDYQIDSYHDNIPNKKYQELQVTFLNECWRVLKPMGAIYYNHKNRYENHEVITPYSWILKSKLKVKQVIIWNRKRTFDFNITKYAPYEEFIFWMYKEKTFPLKKGANLYTSIWDITRPTNKQNMGHKATFPYQLIYRIINSLEVDWKDKTILDPYLGTGTTLQVAKLFNFKEGIGIDISDKWLEVSKIKINTKLDYYEEIPQAKMPHKKRKTKWK